MASAYTLFGELKADTRSFQDSLRRADASLKDTEKAITQTEQKALSLGKTSAVSGRGFEKLRESVQNSNSQLQKAAQAYSRGELSVKQMSTAINQAESSTLRLNSRIKDSNASLSDFANRASKLPVHLKNIGQSVTDVGQKMAIGITAPLLALGYSAVNSAVKMDSLTRGLQAVSTTGGTVEEQLKRLKEVAKLPGLGFAEAVQGSINLQATGLSAGIAERSLAAFGNALATVGKGKADLDGVITALSQIQSKGKVSAEEINQIAERVPQIRKVMQEVFGTADTEALQKMGISSEQFIEKIVGGLEKIPKVTGGVQNSFENIGDSISQALLPLGNAIIPTLVKGIEFITPIIDTLSNAFASMSPTFQTITVGVTALVAALGPVAIVIGSVITAIGTIASAVSAITAISGIGTIIAGVVVVAGVFALAATAAYQAWTTNFGGIRDFVAEVGNGITTVWNDVVSYFTSGEGVAWIDSIKQSLNDLNTAIQPAMQEVSATLQQGFGEVIAWVKENYPLIKETIVTVMTAIKDVVVPILTGIGNFWKENGELIKTTASNTWGVISTIIGSALRQAGSLVKAVMQAINGDWSGAWQSMKNAAKLAFDGVVSIVSSGGKVIYGAIKLALNGLVTIQSWASQQAMAIGRNIVEGIGNALSAGVSWVADKARNLAESAIASAKSALSIQSPSKVFYQIGMFVAQGFANGIAENSKLVTLSVQKMTAETIAATTEAIGKAFITFDTLKSNKAFQLQVKLSGIEENTAKLQELIKLRIELKQDLNSPLPKTLEGIIKQLERLSKQKDGISAVRELLKSYNDVLAPVLSETEKVNKLLADPNVVASLDAQSLALLRMKATLIDMQDLILKPGQLPDVGLPQLPKGSKREQVNTAIIAEPPTSQWSEFWQMMQTKIGEFSSTLPDFNATLTDSLSSALYGIGDIFAQAVTQWDGTAAGFFKSIASGFAQMAQQIVADLIRIAIQALLVKALGVAIGGAVGGANAPLTAPSSGASWGTFADGGYTGNIGLKQVAGVVHGQEFVMPAKAVQHYGVDFLESMRSLNAPKNGTSFVPSMSAINNSNTTNNNQRSNMFNINVNSATGSRPNDMRTGSMIRNEILTALRKDEMRNK